MVRLIVGVIALAFVLRWLYLRLRHGADHAARPNRIAAAFWGAVAGFTSFVAHVGGPPFQVYALPLRLDPKLLAGTTALFFAVTNALKLVPYFALGPVRLHQPDGLAGTGAAGAAGHDGRRLAGAAHAPGNFLPPSPTPRWRSLRSSCCGTASPTFSSLP